MLILTHIFQNFGISVLVISVAEEAGRVHFVSASDLMQGSHAQLLRARAAT